MITKELITNGIEEGIIQFVPDPNALQGNSLPNWGALVLSQRFGCS